MTRRLSLAAVTSIALALGGCGDEEPIPPLTAPEPEAGSEAPATTGARTTIRAPARIPPRSRPRTSPRARPRAARATPASPSSSARPSGRCAPTSQRSTRATASAPASCSRPGRSTSWSCPSVRGAAGRARGLDRLPRPARPARSGRALELARVTSVELDGDTAKVVATVVTRFADRDEPSIEDDIVYLSPRQRRLGDREAERDALPRDRRRGSARGARAPPASAAPTGSAAAERCR